jgi:hypothetical protein
MNSNKASGNVPPHVRRHLLSYPRSGLSVQKYCEKHSISTWSFYQWRKRYQSKLNTSARSGFSFAELGILEHAGCVCDIRFPTGITVSVRRGVCSDELGAILELVATKQPC